MIETKLNGTTPDIAEENIAKLKEIFPDVFCEGKVDFASYIEALKEVGFDGFLTVERETGDDPTADIIKALNVIKTF